jgi:ribose/xylose/arabinose/galactoside ABC-type transport system permease subunit
MTAPSMRIRRPLRSPSGTIDLPVGVIVLMTIVLVLLAQSQHRHITSGNGYDIFQNFADLGWVTLAIGLSMIVGEFDLSVPASYALGGTVAVLVGGNPWLGLLAASGVGLAAGLIQGLVIARLRLSSVPVTLAGYLIMFGLGTALLHEKSVSYANYSVGERLNDPIAQVLSLRSLVIVLGFVLVGIVLRFTRLGTSIRALGGDRRASTVTGVPVKRLLVAVFATGGALAAASGALVDYSLATASPNVQLTPLVFAVTASVLGGVGIAGGKGSALGIAIAVLALSQLQEGLVILNTSDNVTQAVTGALLLVVALIAAPGLKQTAASTRGQLERRRAAR